MIYLFIYFYNDVGRQIMSTDIEELARANNDLDKGLRLQGKGNCPTVSIAQLHLRVFWSFLPSPIHCLGKEVMAHRNAAFCSAMQALEEASAAEGVIHCMRFKKFFFLKRTRVEVKIAARSSNATALNFIKVYLFQNSGSSDSTGLYFEAALKFLTGAALFESCSNDSAKHNEMTQSGQIYSSTAKLCEKALVYMQEKKYIHFFHHGKLEDAFTPDWQQWTFSERCLLSDSYILEHGKSVW
nr:uncharacterized protein LOC109160423 [Ipomoea batatas]